MADLSADPFDKLESALSAWMEAEAALDRENTELARDLSTLADHIAGRKVL